MRVFKSRRRHLEHTQGATDIAIRYLQGVFVENVERRETHVCLRPTHNAKVLPMAQQGSNRTAPHQHRGSCIFHCCHPRLTASLDRPKPPCRLRYPRVDQCPGTLRLLRTRYVACYSLSDPSLALHDPEIDRYRCLPTLSNHSQQAFEDAPLQYVTLRPHAYTCTCCVVNPGG